MHFNQRMASRIVSDLEKANANQISLNQLEELIECHLKALDSTFPKDVKRLIDKIIPQIHVLKQINYAANLNTENEGEEDAEIRDASFDEVIASLQAFIAEQ